LNKAGKKSLLARGPVEEEIKKKYQRRLAMQKSKIMEKGVTELRRSCKTHVAPSRLRVSPQVKGEVGIKPLEKHVGTS